MTSQEATRFIDAPPAAIRDALLDARALPDWNPAFQSIEAPARAATGARYPIVVRGLHGHWEYTLIAEDRIEAVWQIPGFRETGVWRWEARGAGTVVTHAFEHRGGLARVLAGAYRGVAELRLDRLTLRTAQ
ncbi:SRPBCC family protein [Actinomadura sp. DC4]|uniref:SRPBCC family protein n=1 Tax=Actinomadura sp. DC4 TaxID=3055069 RepID=UPI0025AF4AFC|nr:SRPBCC family protein [Actinomadura sp. DC4]MDN3354362.1 SRPBCC family protein [Actinomadura sp. DC4]